MKYLRLKHYRDGPQEFGAVQDTWAALIPGGEGLPITDGPFIETSDLIAEHAHALSIMD